MWCQIWHSLLELLNLQAKATMFFDRDKDNRRFSQEEATTSMCGENVVVEYHSWRKAFQV